MDFYRDIRYLNYQDKEHQVENIGSVKFFFRRDTGKADIYIKKIPCLYPIECKLVILKRNNVQFSQWIEIDRQDWQKSFEFSFEQPYEDVQLELVIGKESKICEREKEKDVKEELKELYEESPQIRMQQISRDEIETVPVRNEKAEQPSTEPLKKKAVKIAGSENEYYMSRISELGELSKELEPLEHNSFLLHGYFNYRHLLIRKEGERFLVGVPGNYYYREEMVAAMFGFPNFVPAKKQDEREKDIDELFWEEEKKVGEFGYYFEEV